MNPAEDIVIYHGDGEWSALYVNGKLEQVGDTYLTWEALVRVLEIEEIQSDDFMCGGHHYGDVGKSIAEIQAYQRKKHEAEMTEEFRGAWEEMEQLSARLDDLRETYGEPNAL